MTVNVSHLKLLLQLDTWTPPAVQLNMPAPHPGALSDLFDARLIDRDAEFNLVLTPGGRLALQLAVEGMRKGAKYAESTSQSPVASEKCVYVIRYDDGAYNLGPEGSDMNGFPATLSEASRYSSLEVAEAKAVNLRNPDGTGITIIPLPAAILDAASRMPS